MLGLACGAGTASAAAGCFRSLRGSIRVSVLTINSGVRGKRDLPVSLKCDGYHFPCLSSFNVLKWFLLELGRISHLWTVQLKSNF